MTRRTVRHTVLRSLNGEQICSWLEAGWSDYSADDDTLASARLEVADWANVHLCAVSFDADSDQFLIHGEVVAHLDTGFLPAPYALRTFGVLPVAAVA